ncbi:MAG: hypothetical protein ACI38Q_04730 [Candidatus Bruticola sp.]
MNTNASSNHTDDQDNIKINWPKLAVSSLSAVILIYVCIWLLGRLFNGLMLPKDSPFVGLIPTSVPFAAEGSPKQATEFLQKRCGLIADFNSNLSQKYPKARILVALMPSNGLSSSLECQSYLLDLASNIEELWNKNSAYPTSISPFPPCPEGGQAVYNSDGQKFTIICTGRQHRTVYSSTDGLAAPVAKVTSPTPTSTAQAPSNLPERANRNLEEAAKDRLESLQDTPSVLASLKQTDISADMQARESATSPEAISDHTVSFYEKTITASGRLAEELDNKNVPLGLRDLPSTFKFREPFIIAVANVDEDLPECFRLPGFKNLQIWASSPESAQKILADRNSKSESLFLQPADTTDFQIICQSSVFNELFQDLPLKLPADSTINLFKSIDSQQNTESYTGKIWLPDRYRNQLEKIAAKGSGAEELLSNLSPHTVSFSGNSDMLKILSVPNLGWTITATQDNQEIELQPNLVGVSLDVSKPSSLKQIFVNLAKAFKGRVSFNTSLLFDNSDNAAAWSANSTIGKVAKVKGSAISIQTGSLSKGETVSLPKGPTAPQVCGWFTLQTSPNLQEQIAFSLGVAKTEEDKTDDSIWLKIDKRSK